MMKSHDAHLGVIVNHINAAESDTLQNAWNMTTDWGSSRLELLPDARADGAANAGRGRLSGLIEVTTAIGYEFFLSLTSYTTIRVSWIDS
jgi:hypothetical protein